MKHQIRALIAAGYCLMTASVAVADGEAGGFTELQVGRTQILCYQQPCPWNGVWHADRPAAPHALLWSGDVPPPMRGSDEDRLYLRENYGEHCTLIRGGFRDGVLEIAEVLGRC